MHFVKMEGLGNDYIYFDCMERTPVDLPGLAVRLSDRHFGVGADGLICIQPGRSGDFSMVMYNADGSRGAMCGNGIRCVGKYVYEAGLTRKSCLTIDTDAGPRELELHVVDGMVDRVTVDMGVPVVGRQLRLEAAGEVWIGTPVSVGNPHIVLFAYRADEVELERIGPLLECHPQGKERSNVEVLEVRSREELSVRVWERGSGITLACGTGACAAFVAAWKQGQCESRVRVWLPGGALELERQGERVWMTGPARRVFEGDVSV